MGDLISRQAAIDALGKDPGFKVKLFGKSYDEGRSDQWFKDVYSLTALPSAQPEIIHCRECKHGKFDIFDRGMWCELHPSLDVTEEDFCSRAERRGK